MQFLAADYSWLWIPDDARGSVKELLSIEREELALEAAHASLLRFSLLSKELLSAEKKSCCSDYHVRLILYCSR